MIDSTMLLTKKIHIIVGFIFIIFLILQIIFGFLIYYFFYLSSKVYNQKLFLLKTFHKVINLF